MVKALIGSFLAAALVGSGIAASRAAANDAPAADPKAPAKCAVEGACSPGDRCDATIECTGDGCIIRWTAPDGRTGECELSCVDGECKVVRCEGDGCEGDSCKSGGESSAKPECETKCETNCGK